MMRDNMSWTSPSVVQSNRDLGQCWSLREIAAVFFHLGSEDNLPAMYPMDNPFLVRSRFACAKSVYGLNDHPRSRAGLIHVPG